MHRLGTTLVTLLLTSLALAQPATPEELASRQHAAMGMVLTIILGLAVVIVLLHILGRRQSRPPSRPEEKP